MNAPLFSIITVTLNPGEEDLLDTVNSVLAQEFGDWELIIKDGGSTDGSLSCLPGDKRIKIFNETDSGIFDAMNQAIKFSAGEFICFLNAGDTFFDSHALGSVNEAHKTHSNVDFFYGDVHKPMSRSGYEIYPDKLSKYFLFTHMVCHQAWFVRKDYCMSSADYETTHPTGGDYRFLLRMVLVDKVKYQHISNVLIHYKGGGVSQDPKQIRDSRNWRNEARALVFSKREQLLFSVISGGCSFLKKAIYDPFLYKIWAVIKKKRFG